MERRFLQTSSDAIKTAHCKEVWFADLGCHQYPSSIQDGIRPVLIISNEKNNQWSHILTVIPFTSRLKRLDLPTHVIVDHLSDQACCHKSLALVEQMTTIDKSQLIRLTGTITDEETLDQIRCAINIQLGL